MLQTGTELFEQMEFKENPLYEQIIQDILEKKYSIVDGFFDSAEVDILRAHLLEKYEEDNFKKAAIGNKTSEVIARSIRGDFILWINEADAGTAEKIYFNKINSLVDYLNRTCFMGILTKEFHYAVYPEGTFYKRHLDTFQNDGRRKLSMVCYLNNEDWKPENGGELSIYTNEGAREEEIKIYPFPGRVVIFESQELEHEVKPVKVPRLSITGWLKTR
ncbi:2OG-Fe(II) oxygenase [Christiangramia forsetii]|uniref:2OG-Fe(II) oxygenase family protein n=2 Tax=Christiangramia forsetii TaxID=411153 RepID=A0M6R0_CHRFK|nr:2OG-Fe(II) oxygenase [Christiangramia forsetii]GGG29808.1 oxidoreductase [Christiangramia forsetii]CAL68305.1 2OG-Fe(II) oxygenase family protein [Christiangramia forsetii KT0803]